MSSTMQLAERLTQSGDLQNLPAPYQTALFLGAMTLIPALIVCLTPFTRIVIVLGFVRRAVTSQDIPSNVVLLGLALFLTLFVCAPTLDAINTEALEPYLDHAVTGPEALQRSAGILQKMMLRQTRRQDLALFIHLAHLKPLQEPRDTPFHVLVPAFLISELKTAFIMGFCIYVPFLLVDLVISSILTAMGMTMMPPVVISAPFKILLFVLADGWHLVVHALSLSFG